MPVGVGRGEGSREGAARAGSGARGGAEGEGGAESATEEGEEGGGEGGGGVGVRGRARGRRTTRVGLAGVLPASSVRFRRPREFLVERGVGGALGAMVSVASSGDGKGSSAGRD